MSSVRRLEQVYSHLSMDNLPNFDQLPNFKDYEGELVVSAYCLTPYNSSNQPLGQVKNGPWIFREIVLAQG